MQKTHFWNYRNHLKTDNWAPHFFSTYARKAENISEQP